MSYNNIEGKTVTKKKNESKTSIPDQEWRNIFNDFNIIEEIERKGKYEIDSEVIKKYREPRLMAKWDYTDSLPVIFKETKINILPISRGTYLLGQFLLYEKFPEDIDTVTDITTIHLDDFETINIKNISSEATAINILQLSGILEDFLKLPEKERLHNTFNGRMSSGEFDFKVNTIKNKSIKIEVKNAQIEIDGGFESENNVVILEAKNSLNSDFNIRQLYYPYRLWYDKVKKPIRLIFSIYSNKIFRLFEYKFKDKGNYSSIELVAKKNYSLEDTSITMEELKEVHSRVVNIQSDDDRKTPFPQADKFERVINLLERLYRDDMSGEEIESYMDFTYRQKDYYYNAGKYLELFEKYKTEEGVINYKLSKLGKSIYKMNYKERQLKLVEQIFSHKIFNDLFKEYIRNKDFPTKKKVEKLIRKNNKLSNEVISRRASTVLSWFAWVINLDKTKGDKKD